MATFRNVGTIDNFREKMVGGMVARGYKQDFAERCFKQIEGFGSYGFPESHAQSFARLVYVSSWIKYYHHRGGGIAWLGGLNRHIAVEVEVAVFQRPVGQTQIHQAASTTLKGSGALTRP